jgi:hypothetical protein
MNASSFVRQPGDRVVPDAPILVLAKQRVVPRGVLDGQSDKPSEQQIALDLLEALPPPAHAVKHLQQHGAHELFWCNARAACIDVGFGHGRQLGIRPVQRVVDPAADRAQWVTTTSSLTPSAASIGSRTTCWRAGRKRPGEREPIYPHAADQRRRSANHRN